MKESKPGEGRLGRLLHRPAANNAASARRRKLLWVGEPAPAIVRHLVANGWEILHAAPDADLDAVGADGADVAIADFAAGDEARISALEALFAARHAVRWIAIADPGALSVPRVCEVIHDTCFDFFVSPLNPDRIAASLGHAWGMAQLRIPTTAAASNGEPDLGIGGTSSAVQLVRSRLRKFAAFELPVLVTGETGTGKELAAMALHANSARRHGPYVAINCGALPENLVQSELFGHERGAFTGALQRKIGRIEAAEGGTVFFDEIGDLPLDAQVNLLRFLQEQTIERVGSTRSIKVNARVVAATHVDLRRAVREGRFREDLYYRLNVLHIHLPPLRERDGDAERLAEAFLAEFRRRHGTRAKQFSAAALRRIAGYSWPGNVRELLNRVQSAAATADGHTLLPGDLGLEGEASTATSLHEARAQIESETIVRHLRESGFNMSECARRLNISRVTLYRLCRKYRVPLHSAWLLPAAIGAWLATQRGVAGGVLAEGDWLACVAWLAGA